MKEKYENLASMEKEYNSSARFGAIYRLYLSKLWHTMFRSKKALIFEILMFLPIIAGPIVALTQGTGFSEEFYMGIYSDLMYVGYFGIIIPLFTMYIASMMFNDEINDRSLTYLSIRPVNRLELVVVKYLTYLTIVPLFSLISTGIIYLSFGIFARFIYLDLLLWFSIATVLASVVYGALFMVIGLLFKNPLWFGLFFTFIWEFVIASFSFTLNRITVGYYIKSFIVFDPFPNDSFRDSPAIFDGSLAQSFSIVFNPAKLYEIIVVLLVVVIVSITLSWSLLQGDRFKVPYGAGRRPGGWRYYLKEIRSFLITFGIIFVTMGIVIGPVTGLKGPKQFSINFDQDVEDIPYWYYSIENPSLEDIGLASFTAYSVSKGDSLNFKYDLGEDDSFYSATYYGLLCSQEDFNDYFEVVRGYWSTYAENYDFEQGTNLATYQALIDNCEIEAYDLIGDADYSVLINPSNPESNTIEFTNSPARVNYYVVFLIVDINVNENQYLSVEGDIYVTGEGFRRGGYATGWVIFALGLVSIGFSGYSLATYSSADEIARYNEQVERFKDQIEEKPIEKVKSSSDDSYIPLPED